MTRSTRWLRWVGRMFISGSCLTALIFGFFFLRLGSASDAVAYLRGDRILVSPQNPNVGEGQDGETKQTLIRLRNLTGRPLVITGGSTSCTCVYKERYPIRLDTGKSFEMTVSVRLSDRPGMFPQLLVLYTDDAKQPEIPLRIVGRVRPARKL